MNDKTSPSNEHLQRVLALTSSGARELSQPRAGLSLPQRWLLAQLDGEAALSALAQRPGSPAAQRLPRDAAKLVGLGLASDVGEQGPTLSDFGPVSELDGRSGFGPGNGLRPADDGATTAKPLSTIERAQAVLQLDAGVSPPAPGSAPAASTVAAQETPAKQEVEAAPASPASFRPRRSARPWLGLLALAAAVAAGVVFWPRHAPPLALALAESQASTSAREQGLGDGAPGAPMATAGAAPGVLPVVHADADRQASAPAAPARERVATAAGRDAPEDAGRGASRDAGKDTTKGADKGAGKSADKGSSSGSSAARAAASALPPRPSEASLAAVRTRIDTLTPALSPRHAAAAGEGAVPSPAPQAAQAPRPAAQAIEGGAQTDQASPNAQALVAALEAAASTQDARAAGPGAAPAEKKAPPGLATALTSTSPPSPPTPTPTKLGTQLASARNVPPAAGTSAASAASGGTKTPVLRPTSIVDPEFPREGLGLGTREVSLTAKLSLDASGRVTEVDFVRGGGGASRVFERAARKALMQWRFPTGAAGRSFTQELSFKEE